LPVREEGNGSEQFAGKGRSKKMGIMECMRIDEKSVEGFVDNEVLNLIGFDAFLHP
jgi:hypothetical protein